VKNLHQDTLAGGFLGDIFSKILVNILIVQGQPSFIGDFNPLFVLGTGISFISLVKYLGRAVSKID